MIRTYCAASLIEDELHIQCGVRNKNKKTKTFKLPAAHEFLNDFYCVPTHSNCSKIGAAEFAVPNSKAERQNNKKKQSREENYKEKKK